MSIAVWFAALIALACVLSARVSRRAAALLYHAFLDECRDVRRLETLRRLDRGEIDDLKADLARHRKVLKETYGRELAEEHPE